MMGSFHDEEFDGIVLKIPTWFIKMNKLEGNIQSLLETFEGCQMSKYHPDNQNNIKELEEWKTKSETIKDKRDRDKENIKTKQEWQEKIYKGEAYELVYEKETDLLDMNMGSIHIDGKEYSQDDIFAKSSIKQSFIDLFKNSVQTFDGLNKFINNNPTKAYCLARKIEGVTENTIQMGTVSLFYSTQGWYQLGISFEVLKIKYEYSKGRKHINCRLGTFLTFEDGSHGIGRPYGFHGAIKLDPAFKRIGRKLIKK